mmetsp:Transcript_9078/g.17987  ORF Transcript_9078/g.17987 Transcript_9078/m.17987 type:complete len:102 (-) Transcript_9078:6-311(-)
MTPAPSLPPVALDVAVVDEEEALWALLEVNLSSPSMREFVFLAPRLLPKPRPLPLWLLFELSILEPWTCATVVVAVAVAVALVCYNVCVQLYGSAVVVEIL